MNTKWIYSSAWGHRTRCAYHYYITWQATGEVYVGIMIFMSKDALFFWGDDYSQESISKAPTLLLFYILQNITADYRYLPAKDYNAIVQM